MLVLIKLIWPHLFLFLHHCSMIFQHSTPTSKMFTYILCFIPTLLHKHCNVTWLTEALQVSPPSALESLLSRLDVDSSLSGLEDLLNCAFSMKLSIPSALYGCINTNKTHLTLSCPQLPYGHSYKASRCQTGLNRHL